MNKSILFVCLGNICRSPMAEYIFKYITKNKYIVSSRATSNEETNNDIYFKAKEVLRKNKIPYDVHHAKKITKEDYENYDIIVCFDEDNYKNLIRMFKDSDKIRKIQNYDVEDPWYTGNFDLTFKQIYEGCIKLKEELEKGC